jgi:hypothetical protein
MRRWWTEDKSRELGSPELTGSLRHSSPASSLSLSSKTSSQMSLSEFVFSLSRSGQSFIVQAVVSGAERGESPW